MKKTFKVDIKEIGDYTGLTGADCKQVADFDVPIPEPVDGGGAVDSVNGQTGVVVLDTDDVSEGATNLYFTTARVLATLLTGISFATGGAIVSTDSVLVAFGKIQKQISDISTLLKNQNYINNTATGALDLDWSKKVQRFTLTGAVVFTNSNLPTGTDTAILEVYIKGSFTIDLSAIGTADSGNDVYNGTKWNRFIFSCTNLGSPLNIRYTIQTIDA